MIRLGELPALKEAFDLMGLDIGADAMERGEIPDGWETRARLADEECSKLSRQELLTLTQGEEGEMAAIGLIAPNAHLVLDAAFDGGPLDSVVFRPWYNINDARKAETRVRRKRFRRLKAERKAMGR